MSDCRVTTQIERHDVRTGFLDQETTTTTSSQTKNVVQLSESESQCQLTGQPPVMDVVTMRLLVAPFAPSVVVGPFFFKR